MTRLPDVAVQLASLDKNVVACDLVHFSDRIGSANEHYVTGHALNAAYGNAVAGLEKVLALVIEEEATTVEAGQ